MIFTDVCVLTAPMLQAEAIRAIEGHKALKTVFIYSFGVFFVIVLAGFGRYFWRMLYASTSMKVAYDLRNDLYGKLTSFSPKFFAEHPTGDLMARATNDLEAVRRMMGPGTLVSIDALVLGIPSLVMMFLISWKLALLALIPLPIIAIIVAYFQSIIHKLFEKVQEQFSDLSEKVREHISGIRVIKTYVQEEEEIENFREMSTDYVDKNIKYYNIDSMFRPIIRFFAVISQIIILSVGGMMIIDGVLDLGIFWAFYEYLMLMIWPMIAIGWTVELIQRGTASMKRLNKIFKREPEITAPEDPEPLENVEGKIEYRNVSFKFEDQEEWALKDINISLDSGEKLGIVGTVGAGKSALFGLLLRFYDPQEGNIFIDGINVKDLSLYDLRKSFGFVPQETFLFSDSIKENIVFGIAEYSEEEVREAADIAMLEKSIEEFPNEYDTLIGEKGVTLSGGQKQRTAISRALITDPDIIIMDDAFSNLDTETEERIQKNLNSTWKDKTTIVVSHRVSTVKNFDHIIVMDEGKIVEEGTHEELIDKEGIYSRIYERQKLKEALA